MKYEINKEYLKTSFNRFIKHIVPFCIFLLVALNGKAAVGCLSSSTTYTYLNPTGGYVSGAVEYYHRNEADRKTTASNFCTQPITPSTACYITSTRSGYSSSPGTLVNYSTVNNCAVDDYIGLMIGAIGLVGFVLIRKNFLLS